MSSTFPDNLFKEYYINNKGILYKRFEININNFHYDYDIYWGDPNIIFDKDTLRNTFPLAVTIIPHRYNYPNNRIFLHEKLIRDNKNVFELIVAHEIGHLWLHDIVGFNNPCTHNFMNENDSEMWADYFAYSFFVKYRNINCIEDFGKIFEETSKFQMELYNLDPIQHLELTYTNKLEKIKTLNKCVIFENNNKNSITSQMINAIEITLNSLGDIFKDIQ